MLRISSNTNTNNVEIEINKLANNWFIPKDMAQLFAEINSDNYYPIPTYCDSDGKIVIDDIPNARNKKLILGTKNQFLYKRFNITQSNYRIKLDSEFKTGWNPKHYIVFRNGYLLNPALWEIVCPTLDTSYKDKYLFSRTSFIQNDWIDVFYIEHECNFKEVKFNQDVYIKCVKVYCSEVGQRVIKIPYPYHSYPKADNMFYVFSNVSKRFLVKDGLDYTLDSTNTHIYIHNKFLTTDTDSSFTFVFPYCTSEHDFDNNASVGETSDLSVLKRFPTGKTGANLLFDNFDEYTITQDNSLLLCNDNVVNPSEYNIVNNTTVSLLSRCKYYSKPYSDFVLILYKELDDYTDCKPNKLLQYDMFMVVPTIV